MNARTLASAAVPLALIASLTGCATYSLVAEPSPSAGLTPIGEADPDATVVADESADAEDAITAEELCDALRSLDVEALIGAAPYEYVPTAVDPENTACLANADEDSAVSGGISATYVTGADALKFWQEFLALEGVVHLEGIRDSAIYDEDPESGPLPVVTVAMLDQEALSVLQLAPVVGAPVPAQQLATDAFVDLLDAIGIPH
jgi:hypothetical protein